MLSIFKINDPYRLIIVLLFLIAVQLPFYFSDLFITIPEIEWQVLGRELANGKILYVDVYHNTGILSSLVYWLLSELLPGNYFIYRIIGLLLIFFQALVFNVILIQSKAYNQNTYVPAAVYALLMMGIPDIALLSPQLMSLTFILFAFDLTFQQIEGRRKQDWMVLKIGLYIGIAMLFYPLSYLVLLSTILAFVFYTNTIFRRYFLILVGFMLPFLLVWLKYYWFDQQADLNYILKYLIFPSANQILLSWRSIVLLLALPILLLFMSFIKILKARAFINYQIRLQNFMLIMILVGFVMIFFDYHQSSHVLVMLIPALSFFITHFFLMFRKTWLAELIFLLFAVYMVSQNFLLSYDKTELPELINIAEQRYKPVELPISLKDKKVLVLGDHRGEYYRNELATPYLSWEIARHQIEEMDNYERVIKFFNNFSSDMPEVLIDKDVWVEKIFNKIPQLSHKYKKLNDQVYLLM
ncbi:MAG: hypothetical protein KFF73_08430 [Cyclobacteriaceae bacterium]|nr:hypothetical protein [Cyclobacteriaceae bacterium]